MSLNDPLKIGLLFSATGNTAPIEQSQLRGALQAIDEINSKGGAGGRQLLPVHYDPACDARLFGVLAERLYTEDGVNVIFGGYTSTSRKAILPVVEKHNRLLFYPQQYEGFEFSEHIIYGGASPNQNCLQLAEYMTETFGARVYMVGSRYIYPYECNRNMQELILQNPTGAIVGERYLDLAAARDEFALVIDDIRRKQPDFIFSTVIGATCAFLYQAYAEAGLDPGRMPIGSLNTSETEIFLMGAGLAQGHVTSAPYFQSVDTPHNAIALDGFWGRYGNTLSTDMNWEAAYYQVHLFALAFDAVGLDDFDPLISELRGLEYDAPQGRVRIDARNQHTALNPKIGRADANGQFEILRGSRHMVPPDPYMVNQEQGDWVTKLSSTER
ncbi:amino acid ABC substrate-binding protein [Comamonas thiooxydans]|uniref:Amino acid ABC substrate-binding protein n=1 Tax=Comamonas thiooxydans TaxID=363952 RepID=A0A0E3BQS1_9BURK|nr:transporter substrate-binding domain-containing protein [Comamonas thiooxydans]KGH04280.1 amino acid ABC substrate-binding protein [Comamonas thiooxydans]KGH28303.1 amino acid ABC substrate-binding protein [Comamonas thiooxydans]